MTGGTSVLNITGYITPSSCGVTWANSTIDLGEVSQAILSSGEETQIPGRSGEIYLEVSCDQSVANGVAVSIRDNQGAEDLPDYQVSLGKAGYMVFFHERPLTNVGVPNLITSTSLNGPWDSIKGSDVVVRNKNYYLSVAGEDTTTPLSAQNYKYNFSYQPFIYKLDDIEGKDDRIDLNGELSAQIYYL